MLLSKPIRTHDDDDQVFKLMALPDHARKTVILNMGAVQMYLISRCSSKMKNLLKKYISHIQFDLQIVTGRSIVFIIRTNRIDLGSFEVKSLDRRTTRELFGSDNFDKLTTFWNDVFHGASRVYKKLLDRFSCRARSCTTRTVEYCIDIRRAIEWTETLNPKLSSISIGIRENVSESRYSYVIKALEQLHSVNIHLHFKRHFNTVDIDMKGKRFVLHSAEWVTLDHLFKFDSVVLWLFSTQITDNELNKFLRAYIQNETSQNLEHLYLFFNRHLDVHSILDGLVWSCVKADEARKIGCYGLLSETVTNRGFLRIIMRNNEICYATLLNRDSGKRLFYLCNFKDEVFNPLKLMKLPYLAVEQVIKNTSLMEAFEISFCSQSLRYFVKHSFKNHKIKLLIEIEDCFLFRLESPNGTFAVFELWEYPEVLGECMKRKIGNSSKIPFYFDKPETNILVTYWRDIVKGVTEFYSLILNLFNIHFNKLVVKKEKIKVDYGSVVGWINRMNRPIEDVHFHYSTVDDTLYQQTIQSQNFRKCIIWQKPSENFTSPEFRFTDSHVIWVIHNASWITLDNLSEIGSVCLSLDDLKLTDQEVNSLLKNLINGKFQNLELLILKVHGRELNRTVMMDDITDLENNQMNRNFRFFDRYGFFIPVDGTTDVQMATGKTCSFNFDTFQIGGEVRSRVNVFIWE